jgi:hypothetical protein
MQSLHKVTKKSYNWHHEETLTLIIFLLLKNFIQDFFEELKKFRDIFLILNSIDIDLNFITDFQLSCQNLEFFGSFSVENFHFCRSF